MALADIRWLGEDIVEAAHKAMAEGPSDGKYDDDEESLH